MNISRSQPPVFDLPNPELHFLATDSKLYDYRNLYAFTEWLRIQIEPFGVNDKHPILLFGNTSDLQVFTFAACWLLKLPVIPLSPSMTKYELAAVLSEITPAVAVTDSENHSRLKDIEILQIPVRTLNMETDADTSLFSSGDPEERMGYFLTSGSTGSPKIVPVKRRQMIYSTRASGKNFKPDPNRYWLLCLPLNHVGGFSIIARCILYHAAIYRTDRFSEEKIIQFLSENRLFQVASMVPTMLSRLLSHSRFRVHFDFKAILIGGGPMSLKLIRDSEVRGIPVVSSYGMTETCGQIASNPVLMPSGIYHPKRSVGRLFKPNEAQIRDDHQRVLPFNETGTLWLRGPQVFDGYLNETDNIEKFDRNGWFNTGDIAYLNREKQLFIQTRRTDLILTGGENVIPTEIENALQQMEIVRESAVIGVPHDEWGQAVIAFIVLAEDHDFHEEEGKEFLKKRLSSYKIPKKIFVLDVFPYTESGKIHKKRLKKLYESEMETEGP